ncbi:hypothetical protein FHT67_002675 [Paenibacillus sp. BK720]|nr:hypothetical protein [Paenibacillus sp. BK720]
MRVLINYADQKYRRTQRFNSFTGRLIAKFDKVIEYTPFDIDEDFKKTNQQIFDIKRGNGLWLWKPYLIKKTLLELNDGDVLFYCDSGSFFIRNINHIEKCLDNSDIWVSGLPLIEKQYTKLDTFVLMDCMNEEYMNSNQASGTFIMLRKSKKSMEFVNQWLNYCCDIRILGPQKSSLGTDSELFIQHREDQSVLSLLLKKYRIQRHLDPSQYGRLPEKYYAEGRLHVVEKHKQLYPTILIHHRTADVKFYTCFKQLLCGVLPLKVAKVFLK